MVIQPGKPQEFDVDNEQLEALLDDAFIEVTVVDETASEATEADEPTTEPEVAEGEVETASDEGEAEADEAETAEAADVEVPTPSSIKKQPRSCRGTGQRAWNRAGLRKRNCCHQAGDG